jgi:hypothetical protein
MNIAKNRLDGIYFNGVKVKLSQRMTSVDVSRLRIPNLLFGNNRTLAISELPTLKDLGSAKQQMLYSKEAGFYSSKSLDEQYIVLPQSISKSFGELFVNDLIAVVKRLYGTYSDYNPTIITFDDAGKHSMPRLTTQILTAIEAHNVKTGYAVVMVPNLKYSKNRSEDELANAIMSKLNEKNVHASIIHTAVCMESFEQKQDGKWALSQARKGKYSGYVRNVALTKVLLLNQVRPFILKDNLTSDLVVSIDVKNHVAGFTIASSNGEHIKFKSSTSGNKELLNTNQIRKYLIELISTFKQVTMIDINQVLILRDGRLFSDERDGIENAFEQLRNKGIVSPSCGITYMGVRKTSLNPIRLFNVSYNTSQNREYINNPTIGTCFVNGNEAYLASTGFPYKHSGTSQPLQLTYYDGNMPFSEALQDVFSLTNLTWSKIDDCSREPLPIKYCDSQLRTIAGEFDNDEIEFYVPEEV